MNIPTFDQLLKLIKLNLWIIGMPFDEPNLLIRFYVLFFLVVLILIEESGFFVTKISAENFLELTAIFPCISIGCLSHLKLLSLTLNRQKLFKLTRNLRNLYDVILNDNKKTSLVAENIGSVYKLTRYYLILNILLISVYNVTSLIFMAYQYFSNDKIVFLLPYAVLVPFSTDTWLTWLIVYIHSVLCGFICVWCYTAIDGLYCILTSLICSNFTILIDDIKNIHSNQNRECRLRELIRSHQYILKLATDLEEIFMVPNLYNVLVGSLQICALGFNLITCDWSHLPIFVLFLLSVLLQILMMSVFGENLIRESEGISEAAFLCKWYEMDERSKKIILILMLRSNKPCQLTSYKFSVISYGTFTKIISTSWSYLTILRTVYKPSEITHEEQI